MPDTKSVVGFNIRWQLAILVVSLAVIGAGIHVATSRAKPTPIKPGPVSSGDLKVSGTQSSQINPSTISTDIPSTSSNASVQTQPDNPGESSKEPLQTNVNINDPALASNPLVQSVNNPVVSP